MDRAAGERRVRPLLGHHASAHRAAAPIRAGAALAVRRDRGSARPGISARGGSMSATAHEATAPKVLLIDSNVFFAKRLSGALAAEGIEVVHCTRSDYALTMIEWNPPAAIVCASNLREMGAFELLPIVHGDEKTAHIPVIAMGDGGGDQALMAAFRAGCADYVERRLGPEQIAAHLRNFLRSEQHGFQPTQMLSVSDTVLSGNLSHLDLPGVVQMLLHSNQSGALYVNTTDLDGVLFFAAGEISHAEAGELVGSDGRGG